jgi:hypothetical protein
MISLKTGFWIERASASLAKHQRKCAEALLSRRITASQRRKFR